MATDARLIELFALAIAPAAIQGSMLTLNHGILGPTDADVARMVAKGTASAAVIFAEELEKALAV